MNEIIKTDKYKNFCGGCNNVVELHRFIRVDEMQSCQEALEKIEENKIDELFKRSRFMGFCVCGNIWLD